MPYFDPKACAPVPDIVNKQGIHALISQRLGEPRAIRNDPPTGVAEMAATAQQAEKNVAGVQVHIDWSLLTTSRRS